VEGLAGRTGQVTIRVRGGDRPGEVRLLVAGVPEHWIAYSTEPVDVGRDVLVLGERGPRQVDVVPWDMPRVDRPGH
jgi:hypothetical protein